MYGFCETTGTELPSCPAPKATAGYAPMTRLLALCLFVLSAGCGSGCGAALETQGKDAAKEAAREAVYVTLCQIAAAENGLTDVQSYPICLKLYEDGELTKPLAPAKPTPLTL